MTSTKPLRFAAALTAILTAYPTSASSADSLAWLPDDPAENWTAQLRLNLEIDRQSLPQDTIPHVDQVLDWVFWGEIQPGENMSARSKENRHLIHELATCSTAANQKGADASLLLTAASGEGMDDHQHDGPQRGEAEQRVLAHASLPPGEYRVSIVLNDPPEAFHVSAETDGSVRIHEFIRDPESRIKLVSDTGEETVAWRHSFSLKVDKQRKVSISIERAMHGLVAFDEFDSFGSMGIVIETADPQAYDLSGGSTDSDPSWPPTVITTTQPLSFQPPTTPFVFTGPNQVVVEGTSSTTGTRQQVWSPTSPQINLGWGGGGSGGIPTLERPTSGFEVINPTPVPEPDDMRLGGLAWMILGYIGVKRRARK